MAKRKRNGDLRTVARLAHTELRVGEAIRLQIAGHSLDEIAKRLQWSGKTAVHQALTRYYAKLAEDTKELALHTREVKLAQLDAILVGLAESGAYEGDVAAADCARRVIETQAKLLGLIKPATVQVNAAAGAMVLHVGPMAAQAFAPPADEPTPNDGATH